MLMCLAVAGAAGADERSAAGLECAAALLCVLLRKRPALAATVSCQTAHTETATHLALFVGSCLHVLQLLSHIQLSSEVATDPEKHQNLLKRLAAHGHKTMCPIGVLPVLCWYLLIQLMLP